MKKALLFLSFIFCASFLSAQCSDLFFSEYVEGSANNKAIEIYNPTDAAINLSGYSLVRYSNGNTSANDQKFIQLPDEMLEAKDVFVVTIDRTDMSLWDTTFDKPVWNGTNVQDTLTDEVTGLPILDDNGELIFIAATDGPPNYNFIFDSNLYDEKFDLQGKTDAFLCYDYDVNNTTSWNGNDAVVLITGTNTTDPNSILDVIGVIGENPESTLDEDAWVDADGFWLTKDRTLVRNADIAGGRNNPADIFYQPGVSSFLGEEWTSYSKNDFSHLGSHDSACGVTSVNDLNEVPFNMYPNPTEGLVTIEAEKLMYNLQVFNLIGQQMKNEAYDGYGAVTIDVSDMTPGIYTISLTFEGNKVSNQKLVIK